MRSTAPASECTVEDPCVVCGCGMTHQPDHAPWCAQQAQINRNQTTQYRPIIAGDGDPRHGTKNGYDYLSCRCDACTDANAASHRRWYANSRARASA